MTLARKTLLLAASFALLGCNKDEPPKPATTAASSAATVTASVTLSAAAPPPAPRGPQIVVDDAACVIDGTRYELAQPDPRGRIAAGLAGKPLVEGQTVEVTILRDTKSARAGHVFAALRRAKAAAARVHSQQRDGKMGEVSVALQFTRRDCSAVAFIAKDNATSVWPLGGGTAARFAKGMAGPDMTLAADGIKKLAQKCDSGVWFVGLDDSHTWAKVFDLALAAKEAGVPPTEVFFLGDAPVPGRKVSDPEP